MQRRIVWLAALATIGLLTLLLVSVVLLPRLLYPPLSRAQLQAVPTAKERIELQQAQGELQNNARTPLLQGLGGLLLIAGVVATWQQLVISREGQITERFTRAIDQLGSDKLDIRLGGIFALERIAKNSDADRGTITEVLSAFVRTHSPWPVSAPELPDPRGRTSQQAPPEPAAAVDEQLPWLRDRAPDVQAVLWVLGRPPLGQADARPHLTGADLRHAYLNRAQMPHAYFVDANLARSTLRGAHLEDAVLRRADLRQTNLEGGFLSSANLVNAHLEDARLQGCHLEQAALGGAQLQQADLRDANLERADLQQTNLRNADLRGANLRNARLVGADLAEARVNATTVWPEGFDAEREGLFVDDPTTRHANPEAGTA